MIVVDSPRYKRFSYHDHETKRSPYRAWTVHDTDRRSDTPAFPEIWVRERRAGREWGSG
jgi:hypothetical protein